MPRLLAIMLLAVAVLPAQGQETKENADFKLAVSLYNDKLYDLALEQFRQFIAAYPNTQQGIEARFYLGLTQSKLNKHEDARFTFQNFALAFPDNPKAPDAWWNVAEAYVRLQNPREAALAFERVKTFHPRSKVAPGALLKASEFFDVAGDRESSKKVLRALTQEYGSSDVVFQARLRLAGIYLSEKQFELARQEARKVADGTKDPLLAPPALQLMAQALSALGKLEEAKTALREITTRYRTAPAYYEALLALGSAERESGDVDGALKTWDQILQKGSTAPPPVREGAFIEMGDVRMTRGDADDALAAYEGAVKARVNRGGESFWKAARAAERLGNTQKAGEYFMKAADDSTGSADRRGLLIGAMRGARMLKSFGQAVRFALKFRELFPSDRNLPRVMVEAADIYSMELNDPRHAADLYDAVANEFSENEFADDALLGYAKALRGMGDATGALRVLAGFQKRFPASELLQQARDEEFAITTFESKNKEGGVENLALLTGEVIAGKPKAEMAYRLAEIYFNDLKEYSSAAAQYAAALEGRLEPEIRLSAWYRRAKSLEYMAWKDRRAGKRSASLAQAVAAYDSLLRNGTGFEFLDDAILSRARLKIQQAGSVSDLRSFSTEFRKAYPSFRGKDRVLVALAKAYQSMRSYNDAAVVLRELLASRPGTESEAAGLYLMAQSNFETGERDSGAVLLRSYLGKYPADEWSAQAILRLARVEGERGHPEEAIRWYSRLDQQFYYSEASRGLDLLRGDVYYLAGDPANALILYQEYQKDLADDFFSNGEVPADMMLKLADCSRRAGKKTEAKRYYAAYLVRDSSSTARAEAYLMLAAIAREENNFEEAARYLQEASKFGSVSPEQRQRSALEAAELLFKNEDYATALARYNEVLPQVKNDSLRRVIQTRIVVLCFRLDNLTEANKRATAFLKANPRAVAEDAEFEFERGRYHLRKEEPDLAIKRFENIRKQSPKAAIIPETVYWLARAIEIKGQPQRAIQLYDSLLQRFPTHAIVPRVQLALGNVYYNLEQWDAAAKQYKAILENEQKAPELAQYAMSNLIMAYKEIGLFDAALQLTRQYIDRFPDDPDLVTKRIDIGVIYQKLGYYDQSILHLQSMLENANPDLEAELRYYIGEAYYYKGEYQQAILEFLKVPYLVTQRTKIDWVATSYYMAGQSYEKMSKFEQAVTMYRQIIERPGIDPTFKSAAQKEIDRVNALVRNGR